MPWRAAAASTIPAPPPERYWEARSVLPIRMLFTALGWREGFAWYKSAATPDTTAPACDVPVPLK
jgi:hypothetical protein